MAAGQAKHRWLMSGTPIQNSPEELFSYCVYLKYEPFDNQATFNKLMKEALVLRNGQLALDALNKMLSLVMLRRTKQSTIDEVPILQIPGRCAKLPCRPSSFL